MYKFNFVAPARSVQKVILYDTDDKRLEKFLYQTGRVVENYRNGTLSVQFGGSVYALAQGHDSWAFV